MADIFIHDSYFSGADAGVLSAELNWLWGVWLFVVGCCFGSFMNVVVYRLPRGLSLAYPPSRCPGCGKAIRWYDNVPVIGWLRLRGKCRDCRAAISPRYPLVEALTGLLFVGLAWVEVFSAHAYLPMRSIDGAIVVANEWLVVGYHLVLVCTLLCAALIEIDGLTPPRRLFVPALVVGFGLAVWEPALRHEALRWEVTWPGLQDRWVIGALEGIVGVVAGVTLGFLGAIGVSGEERTTLSGSTELTEVWPLPAHRAPGERGRQMAVVIELAAIGVFLGWQAVTTMAVIASVGSFLTVSLRPNSRQSPSYGVWLTVLSLGWIITVQRSLDSTVPSFKKYEFPLVFFAVALVIVAITSVMARRVLLKRNMEHLK